MIKKINLLILLVFFFNVLKAQDEESVGWISKFGAAGGFSTNWMMPNFDPLNTQLENMKLEGFPKSGIVTFGGSGYVYIMFWDNVRIGGTGFGGSISRESVVDGYRNQVDYTIGGGGFTIEYTLPFIHKVAVSLGCMIGGGGVQIDIYKNKDNFSWDDVWYEVNQLDKKNEYKKITNSFFTLTPTLNIDIPLNRFIALRLGGGYLFEIGGEWQIDNEQKLFNSPSDLTANSLYLQAGLFFGFFAF